MKLDDVLQNGRKIQILLRNDAKNAVLPAQVCLNRDETFLVTPLDPRPVNVRNGEKVEIWVGCYDAHYTFESVVLGEKPFKDSLCWEVEKPPVLNVSDRRSFFRVRTSMLVKWQKIEPDQAEEWESLHPTSIISLYDLCGAGLSFVYPEEIPVDSCLVFEIPLETESININTTVLGAVVRNQSQDGGFRIGVEFKNITQLQQHLITQHLFSPWRRNIQISSNF